MRIAHVTSFCIPGLGYEENYLPYEQAASGNSVAIVTSDRVPRLIQEVSRFKRSFPDGRVTGSETNGSRVATIRLPSTPEIYGQVLLLGLHKALADFHPDVVHAHGAFTPISIQCLLLKRRLGYRLFIDDHSNDSNFHVNTRAKATYVKAIRAAYRILQSSVAAFIPVVPASMGILMQHLGIAPDRMTPISLGADVEAFRPSSELRQAMRNRLGIGQDQVVVLSAGKLQRDKDVDVLVKAFSEAAAEVPGILLLLAGDGHPAYVSYIRGLVSKLGITNRVFLCDFIPHADLPLYYSGADIGVWPGAPSITVLEAVASGLPCVLPMDDSAYAVLSDHDACLLFERGNEGSLARAITTLVQDGDLRAALRDNARRCAEEELSWNVVSEKLLQIYRRDRGHQ